jgi:hypothetical protein
MPAPETGENVALNFYVVYGQITNDENVFTGIGWRIPNITGNPTHYVPRFR